MKAFFFALLGLVLACGPAQAKPKENSFAGPPIKACPENFAYRIAIAEDSTPEPGFSPAGDVVSWQVARTGAVSSVEMLTTTGKKGEYWVWQGGEGLRPPGETAFVRIAANFPEYCVKFGRYGFPETDWVSRANFVKKLTYQDRPALYFRTRITLHDRELTLQAWVDLETRHPIAVSRNDAVYHFEYLPEPVEKLTPPAGALEAIEAEANRIKRLIGQ